MQKCFFKCKIEEKNVFFFFITPSDQYFVQIKPGFTDFRCFTLSLGRLKNFVFIEYSVWENMLFIKLPKAHQVFKKHKVVIQKMQQNSQKQKITLYNYMYLESV